MWEEHPSFDDIINGRYKNNDPEDNRYFQRKRKREDEEMAKKGYYRKQEDHDGDEDCQMNGDYDTW